MKLNPSPQQNNVLEWIENGSGSAIIEAVAGSGKTTTLIMGFERAKGTIAYMAFNKSVAKEIEQRVKGLDSKGRLKTGTVHSFGLAALRAAYPTSKLDEKNEKLGKIFEKHIKDDPYRFFVLRAVSMAKQFGIGIICDLRDNEQWNQMIRHHSLDDYLPRSGNLAKAIDYAQGLLRASNLNIKKLYDYNDMVYGPVIHDLEMKQYDWVFIDEAQDINQVRMRLAKKMLAPGGRLVAVGDSHQAIYGFTGADAQSMEMIAKEFDCIRLPLTVSYRCPKKVVEVANQWVGHIRATDDAPEGTVDTAFLPEILKKKEFLREDAILCRKTKPLVELAFRLIQSGTPCRIEGKDIGRELVNLSKKWKVSTLQDLKFRLNTWKGREIEKAVAKGNYGKCGTIEDKVETLMVIIDQCNPYDSVSSLTDKINSFFSDSTESGSSLLTLSTIHRAKGKEWGRVFVLDMHKHNPSKWAKLDWEQEQEVNLCYVMVTRAKKHLTFLQSDVSV